MNSNQNQQILQETNSTSEYAKKEPLVYKKTINKTIKIVAIVSLVLGIIIISTLIIISIANKLSNRPITKPKEDEPVVVKKDNSPNFSYIKNNKSIWISDINAEEKKRILELPASSQQSFSSLAWKDKVSITYSKCNEKNTNCSIETLNTETKSTTMEVSETNNGLVSKIKWSPKEGYLAYINISDNYASFKLKTGTINSTMGRSFMTDPIKMNLSSKILFSEDAQYIIYSGLKIYEIGTPRSRDYRLEQHPVIEIYKPNGVQIDLIEDASDPMILDSLKIAYKKEGKLFYKEIGQTGETEITSIQGFNPEISFDKSKIAYWNSEGGFSNALLVVYESNRNIHRNILRGILLPKWISNDKIIGIKAENCLGTNCQLYEFQTNSLAIVDVAQASVSQVDQGSSITEINYNEWYAN